MSHMPFQHSNEREAMAYSLTEDTPRLVKPLSVIAAFSAIHPVPMIPTRMTKSFIFYLYTLLYNM